MTETDVQHYRYAVARSPEDAEFVATVAEFPSLSSLNTDRVMALRGLESLLSFVIADVEVGDDPVGVV